MPKTPVFLGVFGIHKVVLPSTGRYYFGNRNRCFCIPGG